MQKPQLLAWQAFIPPLGTAFPESSMQKPQLLAWQAFIF
jgi:hypothetical protein